MAPHAKSVTHTYPYRRFNFSLISIFYVSLFIKSFFPDEDTICFAKGECQNSIVITESVTLGENSCLNFCQKVDGCNWFTYNSKKNVCVAFSSCPEVVPEGCPECLSGQVTDTISKNALSTIIGVFDLAILSDQK
jgi:hypothetical protein